MNTTICYFFIYLVEAIILWQYTSNLFESKRPTRVRLSVLSVLYFVLFIFSLFELRWLNGFSFLALNFIFIVTQYNLKWYSSLFHAAVISAIMSLCEIVVYGIISCFSPHFFSETSFFYNLVILTVFSKIMYFMIVYIIIYFFRERKSYRYQQDKSIIFLGFIPISSTFLMITFVCIGEVVALPAYLDWMIALNAFILLAINLLVFGINQYNQRKSAEYMEMQLLLQKESDSAQYYEMLRLQNENQRILIHDIKKHLQSIDLLNDQKEHDKINAYIKQLLSSSDLKESVRLCDHEMLNSILCRYMRQCADKRIAFHADIRSGITDSIANSDLTSLFCNLLENAMEAAEGIPDAFIDISTAKREKTPFTVITVINSCRENPFSTQNGKLVTNKPDKHKHGFGIKSIRKAIDKYHGDMRMYYDDDTLTFHTIITIKQ
ncbi:MAG: GHKL domain-containing protein [Alistipes sp.]|nr:GHKL domain-containing protein [Alistipes sp.]